MLFHKLIYMLQYNSNRKGRHQELGQLALRIQVQFTTQTKRDPGVLPLVLKITTIIKLVEEEQIN